MSTQKIIRIGNASGYWGDDPDALYRQVYGPKRLDYITMDFLAEITMSIMQKQRSRDPGAGFAKDFLPMLEAVFVKVIKDGTKIITNAGGINPEACALATMQMARRLGLSPKIAVVRGDDILPQLPELVRNGAEFKNMESGEALGKHQDAMLAANVYFGAVPVVRALEKWAPDIIITGRVTDTGITLAPMIYEFGWSLKDYNKLASGIVAGHLIECGSQSTGGNFSDWELISSFAQIGYPIVEVEESGDFVITKHEGSGGLVSVDTIREQLVYEMGDPNAYITPDVVADFSTVKLTPDGPDRVRVSQVKGMEPTPFYKVSMAFEDGYKCIGEIAISGPSALTKAETFAQIFWNRAGKEFSAINTEYFGQNACQQSLGEGHRANEITLRLGARDHSDIKLKRFSKLVPSLILGGPPGVAVLGGAPKVQKIVSYWPALMPKSLVYPTVSLLDHDRLVEHTLVKETPEGRWKQTKSVAQSAQQPTQSIRQILGSFENGQALFNICLARSGDKGDSANIGVLARNELAFGFLKDWLTAERVKNLFQEFCLGTVTRYEVPNILGLNFILEHALGGGGTVTLRADAQGKTLAQALLNVRAPIPEPIIISC